MKKLIPVVLCLALTTACARLPIPKEPVQAPTGMVAVPKEAPFDFKAAQERTRRCTRWSNMDFWLGFTGLALSGVSTTLGFIAQAKDEGSHSRETLLDIATGTGGGATLTQGLQQYVKGQWAVECAE